MRPVRQDGPDAFTLFAAPGDEDNVDALPAQRVMLGTHPAIVTTWELDEAELHAICAQGGRVTLIVLGMVHPPVRLEVVTRA